MVHLIDGAGIDRHENLPITGRIGPGKSWIARAPGHRACRDGYSVACHHDARVFEARALARGDGRPPAKAYEEARRKPLASAQRPEPIQPVGHIAQPVE